MRGAITLLPQYVFTAGCLMKHGGNFTFIFIFIFIFIFTLLHILEIWTDQVSHDLKGLLQSEEKECDEWVQ
jgi:hypothetical protein